MGIFRDFFDIFIDNTPPKIENICIQSLYFQYQKSLPKLFFDDIFVGVKYDEIFPLLELYKFHSDRDAGEKIAKIFIQIFEKIPDISDEYVIIPIPMHWTRYRLRGMDSLGYIAKTITKLTARPHTSLLCTRFSKRQMTLSKEERQKNQKKKDRKIVLIIFLGKKCKKFLKK